MSMRINSHSWWLIWLFVAVTLLFVFLPSGARAQQKPLLLKDVVQEALDNNPEVRASKFEALAKEAQIGPSGAYEDPMVSFEAKDYPVDTLSPREMGMTGNEIALTQKIPFPGKLSKLRRAATHEYNAQREVFSNAQLQLIREVRMAYYELLLAYHKKDILNEQEALIKQLIVVTRNNYAVGKTPQAELLNFQVEDANLIDQLLAADRQIKARNADLIRLLGRKESSDLGRPREISRTPFDFKKHPVSSVVEKALTRNPDLKATGSMREAADSRLSFAKWNYLPDFEFRLAYTMRQPNMDDRGVDAVSGMVGMSIPLWAFSKQSEEVKGASAEKSKAEAMLDEKQNQLIRSVHTTYAELEEAQKRLELYETALLPIAKQAVVVARPAYLTNKIDYSTLLNSINKRFQTELSYNEALVGYETKLAEFEALTGGPIEEPKL